MAASLKFHRFQRIIHSLSLSTIIFFPFFFLPLSEKPSILPFRISQVSRRSGLSLSLCASFFLFLWICLVFVCSLIGQCDVNRITHNKQRVFIPNFMGICFSAEEQFQFSQQQNYQKKKSSGFSYQSFNLIPTPLF